MRQHQALTDMGMPATLVTMFLGTTFLRLQLFVPPPTWSEDNVVAFGGAMLMNKHGCADAILV